MIDVPGAAEGSTAAFGINNRGDVVGRYVDSEDVVHGFLLRHGRFTTIDVPGSVLTVARGIDDLGRIVGFYAGSDDAFRGFILDSRGYRDIDFPGSDSTAAFDINALKRIVGGYIDTNGIPHGYLLKKGVFTSIDHPDATGTRAFGINILGHIVGGWTDDPECPDCFMKAFLLTTGGFENLEFPERSRPWPTASTPRARSWAITSGRTKSSTDSCAAATTRTTEAAVNGGRWSMGGTLGLGRPALSLTSTSPGPRPRGRAGSGR